MARRQTSQRGLGLRTKPETLRALNGLRFFAAMAIVCFHYAPSAQSYACLPGFVHSWVLSGPIALPFFYILSGFVLSHSHLARLPQSAEARRSFWLARVARLYPVYLVALFLFLPMACLKYLHHGPPDGPREFWLGGGLSLVALQAWTPLSQTWNGPAWSLSVEAFFYFLFPFVAKPILTGRSRRVLPTLCLGWLIMPIVTLSHLHGSISNEIWGDWIANNPLFWTPMFLAGIVLYRVFPWWRDRSSATASLTGTAGLALLLCLCGYGSHATREILINGGAVPAIALIVLAFSHPNSLASRIMGVPILFDAGAVSYVLYITQSPIWHIFETVTNRLRHLADHSVPDWQFLLFLAVLIGVAFLLRRWVERPAQAWIMSRDLASRRAQPDSSDRKYTAA